MHSKDVTLNKPLKNPQDNRSNHGYEVDYRADGTEATINLGNLYSATGLGNVTVTNGTGHSISGLYTYTAGTGGTFANPWATTTTTTLKGGQLELEGPSADVVVNGRSLITTLEAIQRRLNIINVNPELEAEWAELKQLGDEYRALEQQIQDKQATWDRLQAMPPPTVD
jgi:hypothetical protein